MNCYCGHPKSMHDSDGDERQEKFWCNGEDCDCGRFIPFRESRPTPLAPDGGESPLEDSPFETGVRRCAVVIPPAAGKA